MEKYEQLSIVGEGSYGVVLKCRHRETDQIVAIKKFVETEEDATVRRMALREIRMLKKLKHENLVTMIEVFRFRKRFYLVFEFVEGTVLDELEKMPGGLGEDRCRERAYQIARAIYYCHSNNIIHRDVKPENVLVSSLGVVKLCDFGFARLISLNGEQCTEYVATRWYRAPELLVGEASYGPPVDIWAIGCLFAEMMTGDPLFPGESDIDQLHLIVKTIGKPCPKHQQLMAKSSHLRVFLRNNEPTIGFYQSFPNWSLLALNFLVSCVKMDPQNRPTAEDLLKHNYFTQDRFPQRFLPALREKVLIELNANPLMRRYKADILMSTDRKDGRRASHMDPPRWRIQVADPCIKRKLSYDTVNPDCISCDRNSTCSCKSNGSQKLRDSREKPVKGCESGLERSRQMEMQLLEKSLESLSRQNRQNEESVANERASTPPLQATDQKLSSQSVLHPSINNISFGKEVPKKSPNILQSIGNTSLKAAFNHQAPLLNVPVKSQQFLKKLNRNVETVITNTEGAANNTYEGAPWLNSSANNYRKKDGKARHDNFTLPNLPGVTGSPDKDKSTKKNQNLPDLLLISDAVSPRKQSSTSQKSSSSKVFSELSFL